MCPIRRREFGHPRAAGGAPVRRERAGCERAREPAGDSARTRVRVRV